MPAVRGKTSVVAGAPPHAVARTSCEVAAAERMTLISRAVPPVEEGAPLIEAVETWQPKRAADEMRHLVRAARQEVPEHFEKRQGGGTRRPVA